ncbi:MAG: phosphodiester glycosidase family protein [Dysgonamonadaceae bacterium]|jgi:hypothetical protein|nr:phosphodiester glycosidase family protein [Dysgonamonadaceae bacterium]
MKRQSKYLLFFVYLLFIFPCLTAQNTITINGKAYDVEVTENQNVGNAAVYKRLHIPAFPLYVSVLEIDITASDIKIEAWSGKDLTQGKEHPQDVANRKTTENHRVLAAINGDFFGSTPCGGEMILGELSQKVVSPEFCADGPDCAPHIAFDAHSKPVMDVMRFVPFVKLPTGETYNITAFNSTRWEHNLILYNAFSGKTKTETNEWGVEYLVSPENGLWMPDINGDIKCKVEKIRPIYPGEGALEKMDIERGKVVLSGHGFARDFLEKVGKNDEIFINWGVIMDNNPQMKSVENLIGGNMLILQNGVPAPPGTEDRERLRHPRTSVGYNNDRTKVYFVVADGRQTGVTVGVSTRELADIMSFAGADNAINIDGGGSSCMVVDGVIKNTPSEKRNVINGLLLAEILSPPNDTKVIPKTSPSDINMNVYHNTANAKLSFSIKPKKNIKSLIISVYDANGKKIKEVCKDKNLKQEHIYTYSCETGTWTQGTYLYEAIQDNKRFCGKLILN